MGPSDSRKIVAGAVMPRFTTASATRSSSARSSTVKASVSDLVEDAWESSSRTLSHFPVNDVLEKEAITVWKGSQNLLSSGIIWRGSRGVNERDGIAMPSFSFDARGQRQSVMFTAAWASRVSL